MERQPITREGYDKLVAEDQARRAAKDAPPAIPLEKRLPLGHTRR